MWLSWVVSFISLPCVNRNADYIYQAGGVGKSALTGKSLSCLVNVCILNMTSQSASYAMSFSRLMTQRLKVLGPTRLCSSIHPPTEEYRRPIKVDGELTSVGLCDDILLLCISHYLHTIA